MENYDLRSSYTTELPGLHVRIHQFQELLRQHLPAVATHLDDLQVDPAYVSQWFLSFFAVTCPLPMLFRIYDVVFAEGVSETVMRVALSLMQKNQGRILACAEMEDALQLLLSRGLWECYHYNADEFVEEFTSLSEVVSRERLAALELGYREAQIANSANSANAGTSPAVTTAASRFLGRLWSSSATPTQSTFSPKSATASASTLSPGLAAPFGRPLSMLRRSNSKQSLASTLNSMEAGSSSSSVLSSTSTDATSLSRDSSTSEDPAKRGSEPGANRPGSKLVTANNSNNHSDSRYLHSQIEDLLTALSNLQRQHASLADELQREREERAEDRKVVHSLLEGLRNKANANAIGASQSGGSGETITLVDSSSTVTLVDSSKKNNSATKPKPELQYEPTPDQLNELLDAVEGRFDTSMDNRRSSIPQTKSQLRDELARAKEQLANEYAKSQDCNRRVYDMEQEMATLKDQVRETHTHARSLHQDKQRLEKQIYNLRASGATESAQPNVSTVAAGVAAAAGEAVSEWFAGRTATGTAPPSTNGSPNRGLRELKLGRSRSTPSQTPGTMSGLNSRRTSSMMVRGPGDAAGSLAPPGSEHEALILELVQAKTAEAVARQEADEYKQKLESLRKAFGLAPGESPGATNSTVGGQASAAATAAMGMLGRFTATSAADVGGAAKGPVPPASAPATTTSGYGFFGWRRS